jgi:hypothetical protein
MSERVSAMIDIGIIIALSAAILALYGVYLFNQLKDYTGARTIWFFSNTLFVIYFGGRVALMWDGGLGDIVMFIYSALMWGSNVKGLL